MTGAQPTMELIGTFDLAGDVDLYDRHREQNGWTTKRGTQQQLPTGFQAEGGALDITLGNLDRLLDPLNLDPDSGSFTDGTSSDMVPGVDFLLRGTWDGTPYDVFGGKATDGFTQEYDDAGIDQFVPLHVDDIIAQLSDANFPTQREVEWSGERIADIIASTGGGYATDIDRGTTQVSKLVYGQVSAWNHAVQCAQADWSDLYDDVNKLVFRDRNRMTTETRGIVSQATWSDQPDAYDNGFMRYASTRLASLPLINDATVTFDDKGNQRNAQNDDSIAAKWKLKHKDFTLPLNTASQARGLMTWIVNLYGLPRQTFSYVTFKPGDNPDILFPEILGRKLGDLVTVQRTPKRGAGGMIERLCRIVGISHQHQAGNWQTSTFALHDMSWITGIAHFDVSVFDGDDFFWF